MGRRGIDLLDSERWRRRFQPTRRRLCRAGLWNWPQVGTFR